MSVLNGKQRKFVEEYLADLNAVAAAKRAGYSSKTGSDLLTNYEVLEEIQRQMEIRGERTGLTQDYVISMLMEIVDRCMKDVPVLDMSGNQVKDENGNSVCKFDAKNAIRALELLGKHLGMFTERLQVQQNNRGFMTIRWKEASDRK